MQFDTKIAVVLREDLPMWQKLNVAAFTISGIAATVPDVTGEVYQDADGNTYLPMLRQPVLVFAAIAPKLRTIYERAQRRNMRMAIFTADLFSTDHDAANRAAIAARTSAELDLVGLAFRDDKKVIDAVLKGVSLHP